MCDQSVGLVWRGRLKVRVSLPRQSRKLDSRLPLRSLRDCRPLRLLDQTPISIDCMLDVYSRRGINSDALSLSLRLPTPHFWHALEPAGRAALHGGCRINWCGQGRSKLDPRSAQHLNTGRQHSFSVTFHISS